LVGISHRTIRVVDLVLSMHCMSNCNAVDSGGVEEWFEMVGRRDGCCGGVKSTVKVVMVIVTSNGTPMGDACSHSTGNILCVGTC